MLCKGVLPTTREKTRGSAGRRRRATLPGASSQFLRDSYRALKVWKSKVNCLITDESNAVSSDYNYSQVRET